MAYNEKLAFRIRELFAARDDVVEKKMFGGICYMVGEHMSCGVHGEALIVRMSPEDASAALDNQQVRPFDITGRSIKGYVFVALESCATKPKLMRWLDTSTDFVATLPPKKKKKKVTARARQLTRSR